MRELLTSLELLREPFLDLDTLQLDGVCFGSSTAQFPRHKISEVSFSPIVAKHRSRTGAAPEYFDRSGRRLSLDRVIDSVIDSTGTVHFASNISFKIRAARIVGVSIYGAQLRHFDFLKTYREFCDAFGAADRVKTSFDYDGVTMYTHYYFGARKIVCWDECAHVSGIALGEFDGTTAATHEASEDHKKQT